MEDSAAKDQSSATGRSTSRLLRYPLRSATKSNDEKPPLPDYSNSNSTTTKRGRVPSSVSRSLGVLDLSGNEKSAKPPRRLSVLSKSNGTPVPKPFGNTTPISQTRTNRSSVIQGQSDTPVSEVSKSATRKKFSTLSSASYWLSQIKLSEAAAKHSISLGFFKLALEAGCEPIQRMSDELKSYVRRHDLLELGEIVKELFEGFKISENIEPSHVSGNCSQVVSEGEGNQLSDDDVKSSSSAITDAEKANTKTVDINVDETHQVKSANNETSGKDDYAKTTRRSVPKRVPSSKSGSEVKGRGVQKKLQKPVKQESAQGKEKVKKQYKKPAGDEGSPNSPPEEALEENKENMVASQMVEVGSTES